MINSYKIHFLVTLAKSYFGIFEWSKLNHIFMNPYEFKSLFKEKQNVSQKKKFLKALLRALLIWILWVLILGLHN